MSSLALLGCLHAVAHSARHLQRLRGFMELSADDAPAASPVRHPRGLRFGPCVRLVSDLRLGDEPIVQGLPVCATPFDISVVGTFLDPIAVRLRFRMGSDLLLWRDAWFAAHHSTPLWLGRVR